MVCYLFITVLSCSLQFCVQYDVISALALHVTHDTIAWTRWTHVVLPVWLIVSHLWLLNDRYTISLYKLSGGIVAYVATVTAVSGVNVASDQLIGDAMHLSVDTRVWAGDRHRILSWTIAQTRPGIFLSPAEIRPEIYCSYCKDWKKLAFL